MIKHKGSRPKSFYPSFLPASLLPPYTFCKKGPRREGLGRGRESRIGVLASPPRPLSHFRVQATQMEGPVSITEALPAPVALFQRKV